MKTVGGVLLLICLNWGIRGSESDYQKKYSAEELHKTDQWREAQLYQQQMPYGVQPTSRSSSSVDLGQTELIVDQGTQELMDRVKSRQQKNEGERQRIFELERQRKKTLVVRAASSCWEQCCYRCRIWLCCKRKNEYLYLLDD